MIADQLERLVIEYAVDAIGAKAVKGVSSIFRAPMPKRPLDKAPGKSPQRLELPA